MADSRAEMVRSAVSLIGAHGLTATSFADVVAHSGAPRGSIYHHFPRGKRQLATEAVEATVQRVLALQSRCDTGSAQQVLDCFVGLWRTLVEQGGGTAGCAVAGVTVDIESGDELLEVVRSAFRSWTQLLAAQFEAAGVAAARAGGLAVTVVAGMEGALILCRAEQSVAPLNAVAEQLARLLEFPPE